jgi:hypothetical protein
MPSSMIHSVRMARFNTEVKVRSIWICSASSCLRLRRFQPALLGQVYVVPSREEIFDVPGALAVTNENEFSGHAHTSSRVL